MWVTQHSCLSGGNYLSQVRAALETPKLSSSIWKRVTTSPVIVRMIANCVAVIFPVRLDSRLQCTDDRCAAVASEDVIDFKSNGLCQRADITDEIDDRPAASLAADPRKNAVIALDLEYDFSVEQGSNLGRTSVTADPFQQLLCDSDVMLMIYHLLDASDMRSPYPRSHLRLAAKRSRHGTI